MSMMDSAKELIDRTFHSMTQKMMNMFPSMRIRQKFLMNTGLVTVLLIAMGVLNAILITQIHQSVNQLEQAAKVLNLVRKFDYDIVTSDNDAALYLLSPNGQNAQYNLQDYQNDLTQVKQDLSLLGSYPMDVTDKAILNLFSSQWQQILDQNESAFRLASTSLSNAQAMFTNNTLQPLIQSLAQLTSDEDSVKNAAVSNVNHLLAQTLIWDMIIAFVAIMMGLIGSTTLSVSISRPIMRLRRVADEIARGNLRVDSVEVHTRDELEDLARVFNELVANLRSLIKAIADASEHVAASAEELSASTDELMKASEEITHSIEQVAAGADQQTRQIHDTSEAARNVRDEISQVSELADALNNTARRTEQEAENGMKVMEDMESQMMTIRSRTTEAVDVMSRMERESENIRQIASTIMRIADETNLLALNAAIEAARAGEHGRGFGVVADEVRSLANASSDAAREVQEIVRKVMQSVSNVSQSIEAVTTEVQEGASVADETKRTFSSIRHAMGDVTLRIKDVVDVTRNIVTQAEHMTHDMAVVVELAGQAARESESVVASAQQQAGSMQEIASTAASLSQRAQELQMMIGQFRV
ncbi:HAMP domain-containing protein [Alicyclobacillus mali]|uniref:HAMP domain-containing protein n=1 Tax=Alicyclobacillus mali (ex Roth et al. 2021) TaxID=1123961 RepID=A0ABS0F755_9BACL|nr:HAMP domain-containing methyl-accepting chemotaxis protein [Alicyclobacillus mali (ex Roth et al. 2021)]MBF8379139.1 HAMP domain-containing protein [Alicyclobacillus mali (ex Roth et al. 2021)]